MRLSTLNPLRSLGSATIRDDRSPPRQVPLWPAWRAEDEAARPVQNEIAQRFWRRVHPSETETPGPEQLILCLGCLVNMVVLLVVAWLLNLRQWVVVALVVPGWAISMVIARRVFLRRTRQELRALLLARGHCASCGYSLVEVPEAPGGLTVCPECGAAWRLGVEAPVEEAPGG